jgi:hypothetical protein
MQKKMKKLSQATVEPMLVTLINFIGIRRIWTRGLTNADKFMLGCYCLYLKKWLNYSEQKSKTAVIAMKKASENLCVWFFAAYCFTHHHNKKSFNDFITY